MLAGEMKMLQSGSGGQFAQHIEAKLRVWRREGALCVGGIAVGECDG